MFADWTRLRLPWGHPTPLVEEIFVGINLLLPGVGLQLPVTGLEPGLVDRVEDLFSDEIAHEANR
jgi:hypothetical protein